MEYEVRGFVRVRTWSPRYPKACVINVEIENHGREWNVKLTKTAIILAATACDVNGRMTLNRPFEFNKRTMTTFDV